MLWSEEEMREKVARTADRSQQAVAMEGAIRGSGCWKLRGRVDIARMSVVEEWRSMNSLSIVEIKRMVSEYLTLCCYATDIEFFQTLSQSTHTMEDALYFSVRYKVQKNAGNGDALQVE